MTPIEPRPLRIHEVLRDPGCAIQWEHLLRERGARLDVSPEIPPILATEALVCRVFGNLITNAIRHNPSPQPLIRVHPGEGTTRARVEILLEDNGPGFPERVLSRAEHLRGQPSTLKGGFGIAITHRALERLRGSIHLENRPEGGARVRIELPAARPKDAKGTFEQRVRELV
jgi:signal transduction histidine kinase